MSRRSRLGRLSRLGLAALVLVAGLAAERLAGPPRAFACSCVVNGPADIGRFADEPSIIVFIGTVVAMDGGMNETGNTRGTLLIHRLFKGTVPAARMPVVGGGGGDCTISLEVGQQMITAASFENGVVKPGLCMPYGDPTTAEGQRLIDEATKAYGEGPGPPGGPSDPTAPPASVDDRADVALPLAVAGAVGVAVLLFGGLILLSRRKPAGPDA